jgi:nicotinate-nucleotide adenylyltransferase
LPEPRRPDTAPLGLLGGTFDPVHVGHLRLALEVREAAALAQVRLLPAPAPRLRGLPQVSPADRLRMVQAAVAGVEGLAADGRELQASGPTRTVETLIALRAEFPRRPLCWIMGADAVQRLDRWHRWQELPELAHLVIARRPGAELPRQGAVAECIAQRRWDLERGLDDAPAGRVVVCDIPGLDISATGIRDRLAAGRSVDFLVPQQVKTMLISEGMYVDG